MEFPRTVPGSVGGAAGVVVGEAGLDVSGTTDVEMWLRPDTLEEVDESLVFRHARREATPMPYLDARGTHESE